MAFAIIQTAWAIAAACFMLAAHFGLGWTAPWWGWAVAIWLPSILAALFLVYVVLLDRLQPEYR